MKFNFNDWVNKKVAMHCKTEEDAIDFCRVMHDDGKRWCNGASYKERTEYSHYENLTCYDFNRRGYCYKSYFVRNGYQILEWNDYMEKTKPKDNEIAELNSLLKLGKNVFLNSQNLQAELQDIYLNPEKGTTVVKWLDGTITKVTCGELDCFDSEKGIALCFMKRACGNKGNFNEILKKHKRVYHLPQSYLEPEENCSCSFNCEPLNLNQPLKVDSNLTTDEATQSLVDFLENYANDVYTQDLDPTMPNPMPIQQFITRRESKDEWRYTEQYGAPVDFGLYEVVDRSLMQFNEPFTSASDRDIWEKEVVAWRKVDKKED